MSTNDCDVAYAELTDRFWQQEPLPKQYLRATTGLVTEMLQLFGAEWQARKRPDLLEELGDMAFYLERMLQWNGLHLENFIDVPKEVECHLFIDAGELLSCAKRYALDGKELENDLFNRHLFRATTAFFSKLRLYCVSLKEIQQVSADKLMGLSAYDKVAGS